MSTAWTFPGQGSQEEGAGAPWKDDDVWELVGRASATTGVDVGHLLLHAESDELRDTANAQLSTFVVSQMVAAAARRAGLEPDHVAGHSLGEYSALAAGGVLEFEEGCALVWARGMAMRTASAIRPGTMAALLGIDVEGAEALCRSTSDDVWVANDNAPGQVVIAGGADAVAAVCASAKDAGAKRATPLTVAGAFHTILMAPAQEALDQALGGATFSASSVTAWANTDASAHDDPADWSGVLSVQLTSRVRWREQVSAMSAAGVSHFVELGPGKVLTGMVKRIAPDASRASVNAPADVAAAGAA